MRLPLAIAALALSVLFARTSAHAAALSDPLPTGRIVVERCTEQPMSLALQIAEAEAARSLSERSVTSDDSPVFATPASRPSVAVPTVAPPSKPFTPTPRACNSPGEPGCEVSTPFHTPGHFHIEGTVHDAALFVTLPTVPPPLCVGFSVLRAPADAPTDAHSPPPWRPPAV